MNIGTRFDLTAANDTALPRRSRLASDSSAFAENLAVERESFTHRCIQGPGFSLRMGENILCSGGVGGADVQTYEAEFTAGSTDEDPVVRIRGTDRTSTPTPGNCWRCIRSFPGVQRLRLTSLRKLLLCRCEDVAGHGDLTHNLTQNKKFLCGIRSPA